MHYAVKNEPYSTAEPYVFSNKLKMIITQRSPNKNKETVRMKEDSFEVSLIYIKRSKKKAKEKR